MRHWCPAYGESEKKAILILTKIFKMTLPPLRDVKCRVLFEHCRFLGTVSAVGFTRVEDKDPDVLHLGDNTKLRRRRISCGWRRSGAMPNNFSGPVFVVSRNAVYR